MFITAKERRELRLKADNVLKEKLEKEKLKKDQENRQKRKYEDTVTYNVDLIYEELEERAAIKSKNDLTQIEWTTRVDRPVPKYLTNEFAVQRLEEAGNRLADKLFDGGYDCKVKSFRTITGPYNNRHENNVSINIIESDR